MNIKYVSVKFPNSDRLYDYMVPKHWNPVPGDIYIADTPSGLNFVQIFAVFNIYRPRDDVNYKFLVQKVDMTEYKQLTEEYEHALDL